MNGSNRPPLIIGGLGGSGTRVVARIARRIGYFIGTNLTGAEDAIEFWEFYDRWINRYLLSGEVPLSREERRIMNHDWDGSVARHLHVLPSPDALWGWKNPRSILLLPFFHERYPDMKFIHVIRDGRDMAFSATAQDQCRMHGEALIREKGAALPIRTAAFWSQINLTAAQHAERSMENRYLPVRFETLCARPRESVQELLSFLGDHSLDPSQIAAEYIAPPKTIGRWRNPEQADLRGAVEAAAESALRKFAYI